MGCAPHVWGPGTVDVVGAITIDDSTVVSLGDILTALAIIVATTVAVARWLRRQVRHIVEPIVLEVTANGGSSMKDELTAVAESTAKLDRQVRRLFAERRADAAERASRQEALDATLADVRGQLANLQPVLEDYLLSHPEVRRRRTPPGPGPDDLDDDRSST